MVNGDFWSERRVLVTGGGGFLGAWLLRLLSERGARPVGFDLNSASHLFLYSRPLALISGSHL